MKKQNKRGEKTLTHSHTNICIFYIQALYNCTATENVTLFYILKKRSMVEPEDLVPLSCTTVIKTLHSLHGERGAFIILHEDWEHATLIKA